LSHQIGLFRVTLRHLSHDSEPRGEAASRQKSENYLS